VEALPDPELLKELGELYLASGERSLADQAFARSAEENARQAAGGVDVNLETALFSADHRHELDEGLAAAREEWNRRHSVHVADALAWQLFAHGEYEEALGYADQALRLGTRSALFHFHRAEIHRALGHQVEALADYEAAVRINPSFSVLHDGAAQRAITELSAQ
jgi:tetratricopeptide (TPR) repeat protein